MADKKPEKVIFNLPEGRLLNHSLFERDAYKRDEKSQPGKPMYKVEVRFDEAQVMGQGTIEDEIANCIGDKWGDVAFDEFLAHKQGYRTPLLDGNRLAEKRIAAGKKGDAYAGGRIIRASTMFNKDGVDGPGGAPVYGPDTKPVLAANQGTIYQGCYGIAAVTLEAYEASNGDHSVTFYLVAFQKTREGERLVEAPDRSGLFKPVAGAPGTPDAGTRRRRAG